MLSLDNVFAYYGKSEILHGISLNVAEGETVALLGRNGAGKSTTLKSIVGMVKTNGPVSLHGRPLSGRTPHEITRAGVAYVPEGRGIFTNLTVEENLTVAKRRPSIWSMGDVYANFPVLELRRRNRGDQLSGGEQQMLAISRALLSSPSVVLLDEPAEGLAPVIVEQVAGVVQEIQRRGVAVLLVEQRIEFCLALAARVYVLESGQLVYDGTVEEFRMASDIRDRYLTLRKA